MTKEELVNSTLKQLTESLKTTPENFRLEDPTVGSTNSAFPGPTIIWQFRVEIEKDKFIQDPNNSIKTIIVTYNSLARQLHCYIYHAPFADASATITLGEWFSPLWFRSYRRFNKLRKKLLHMKQEKEFLEYMKKLNAIFPATHEDDIFGG
jgi:hypothetical protein